MKQIQITVTSNDFTQISNALISVFMNAGIDALVEKAESFGVLVFAVGKIVEVEGGTNEIE